MAPLRNRTFFSLGVECWVVEELAALNARPFQKMSGSRKSLFEEIDRPALCHFPPALSVTPASAGDASPPPPPLQASLLLGRIAATGLSLRVFQKPTCSLSMTSACQC